MACKAALCVCIVLLMCVFISTCKETSAFNPTPTNDQRNLYCGAVVQAIDGRAYMGCGGGPSARGYFKGGAILTYDTSSGVAAITGISNQSRLVGYGYEFVVKDERRDGMGVNLGSLMNREDEIYLEVRNRAYFVGVDDVEWDGWDAKIDMNVNGTIVLVASLTYNSKSGIVKYYRLEGDSYSFKSNIFPSINQTRSEFGRGLSITADGGRVAISAPDFDNGTVENEGRIFVFHYSSSLDTYEETQILSFKNGSDTERDFYGTSLMISSSGSRLIGCSPYIDLTSSSSDEGACVVYSYDDATMIYSYSQLLVASDRTTLSGFGSDVSISRDEQRMVVGSSISERVYFFQYSPGNASYIEVQILQHPNGTIDTNYGSSVDLSSEGNLLIVGAHLLDLNGFIQVGGSYIYEYHNGSSMYVLTHSYELKDLSYSNVLTADDLVTSMNAEGGFVMQPYSFEEPYPSSYFFFGDDLVWKSTVITVPSEVETREMYGRQVEVSASNRFLAIAAVRGRNPPISGQEEGVVYLFSFEEDSTEFEMMFPIYGDTGASGSFFGSALAIHPNDERIFIGCSGAKIYNISDGAVYVYSFSNTSYSLVSTLTSPSPSEYAAYGSSIFLSGSYLGVGALGEKTPRAMEGGALHMYSVHKNLSSFTYLQKLFWNESSSERSYFGKSSAISTDRSRLLVGAPHYSYDGAIYSGAIVVFSYDGNGFVEYDLIVPLDVQVEDKIGEYMSISSDGNQILIGSPFHEMNGEVNAGLVYHYVSTNTRRRLNGSEHYALEEVILSPDGVLRESSFGVGISIHPTLNITLIGCALSNQLGRDRPTVFIYEDDRLINGSTTSGDGSSDDSFPIAPMLGGLGGGLGGLLLLMCYCFCCVMLLLCVVFLIIILLILVVFVVLVGLGGILGGTGTLIGLMRGGEEDGIHCVNVEMDILDQSASQMPEYKELNTKMIKIEKQIGEGAYGVVFLGKWKGVPVAIKQVQAHTLNDKAREEFLNEIRVMGRLGNHKNIVTFIGAVTEGEQMMLVTKYYSRGALEDYIFKGKGNISDKVLYSIIRDCAAGINHLHLENVVHRDIATRNVLLDADWTGVIADFGYSRFFEGDGGETKSTVGPIPWMAPESIDERVYSIYSDSWMFGAMISEVYTRNIPYGGRTILEIIPIVRGGGHPEIPTNVPTQLQEVMKRCFERVPEDRISMEEIIEVMQE